MTAEGLHKAASLTEDHGRDPVKQEATLPPVEVRVMDTMALGVLTHVAAFRAGLRRGQQVEKIAFLAPQWGL
ncbi:hypothetical protein U0070_010530 [Myodes glareolus]|uniref:Uncharacterized protein n=1 Tax=Myodes glareolus TaxID=447135 RepID=A0AAW0I5H4_MYOGA